MSKIRSVASEQCERIAKSACTVDVAPAFKSQHRSNGVWILVDGRLRALGIGRQVANSLHCGPRFDCARIFEVAHGLGDAKDAHEGRAPVRPGRPDTVVGGRPQ